MSLNLDVTLSYESEEVLEFIYNDEKGELLIPPISQEGFTHDPIDRRQNVGEGFEHRDRIQCVVEEHWAVLQNNSIAGVNKVIVVLGHDVIISTESWLYLRTDISSAARQKARQMLIEYDSRLHGTDVRQWVASQLDATLTDDMFSLETAIIIKKIYSTPENKKIEINVEQRNLLMKLFNAEEGVVNSRIDLLGDTRFQDWSREEGCTIKQIGERLMVEKIEPAKQDSIKEFPMNTPNIDVGREIDALLAKIIPSNCGVMRRKEHKLLTLIEFPEFRIDWQNIRIKLGCVSVTIKLPILRVRLSKIVLYIYYSLPSNAGQTAFMIAEVCAKRSALGAAVIGIVLWNIAAAGAAFESLFKRCIEREVLECIHPGIMTIKEVGNWNP